MCSFGAFSSGSVADVMAEIIAYSGLIASTLLLQLSAALCNVLTPIKRATEQYILVPAEDESPEGKRYDFSLMCVYVDRVNSRNGYATITAP